MFFNATLDQIQMWARGQMVRPPDFVIGNDYLRRWWVIPRNDYCNIYLHEFRRSDEDRALHDHPWPSTSFIVSGQYREHTPEGPFLRTAGDVITRKANALHRVELLRDATGELPAISLFITGTKEREWGFACNQGWVHWSDFVKSDDPGAVGKGCGEPGDLTRVTRYGQQPVGLPL